MKLVFEQLAALASSLPEATFAYNPDNGVRNSCTLERADGVTARLTLVDRDVLVVRWAVLGSTSAEVVAKENARLAIAVATSRHYD
jgi:hypothetical protein